MKTKGLKFLRVTTPEAIDFVPRSLFELFKDKQNDSDVDRWILCAKLAIANPFTFFNIITTDRRIVGIFWVAINIFDNCCFVKALCIDKEYQSVKKGEILKMALNYWSNIPLGKELNKKLVFATTRPSSFERSCVKATRSNKILMEVPYE